MRDTVDPMDLREFLPRAPRLLIRAPVTLRSSSRMPWREGWTVNMSQSGVLVTLASPADLHGDLEFVVTLSKGALQGPGVPMLPELHCRGQVVRSCDGDGEWAIAANIRRQIVRLPGARFTKR